jgi:hypothetical protein
MTNERVPDLLRDPWSKSNLASTVKALLVFSIELRHSFDRLPVSTLAIRAGY